jgi:hypothetical protein
MRVNKFYLCFIIYWSAFVTVNAQDINLKQKKDSILNNITNIDRQLKRVSVRDTVNKGFSAPLKIDTVYANKLNDINSGLQRNENGLIVLENNWMPFDDHTTFRDTVVIDPAFLPVIFDGKILPTDMDFLSEDTGKDKSKEFHLISPDSTFAPQLARAGQIEEARRNYYMNNPQKVRQSALDFKAASALKENVVEKKNIFKELLTTDDPIGISTPEVEKIRIEPVYWIKIGEHSLQMNQNSFQNWYAGGNNNFSILNYHKVNLNYKKNKISFDNTFEWKLNIMQTPADTLHKLNITEDYLRVYSVLGISAYKKWSYTVNLEAKTQLFNGYQVNSKDRTTAFLSPLQVNVGLGMGYKLEKISKTDKYKKLNLALDLSPVSVNYIYVGSDKVKATRFGVEEGKKSKSDFGSTVNLNLSYGFNRYSGFNTRLKYFTNYEKVLVECENKFTMSFSRYLSSSVYLYLRYDDAVGVANKSKGWGYFQFNEMVGFGLTYKW